MHMAAHIRSGALTWGLILIAIGVLLTLGNLREEFSVWRLLARYWPVILIIIGLKKIYGHFTWEEPSPGPDNALKE
jgi:cell wall-active antibiotic response 4TMS protein YvqF